MEKLIIYGILSVPILIISRKTLFNFRSHGFYRVFSWECILWLFVSNYRFWFENAFGFRQIFSWIFLCLGAYLVVSGVIWLKKAGKPTKTRDEDLLFEFEKTSELVDTGIFKYIRHPLYSSLIFLTWGIYLKNVTLPLFIVAISSTIFLYLTAVFDEKECIAYFGDKYTQYMKRTKRFLPFLL